jgi:hypothetical protein
MLSIKQFKGKFNFWNHDFKRKNFNTLTENDISYFRSILSPKNVITDQ